MNLIQEESILDQENNTSDRDGISVVWGSAITVEKAKTILGSDCKWMSDDQIQQLLDFLNWLCNSVRDKKYG